MTTSISAGASRSSTQNRPNNTIAHASQQSTSHRSWHSLNRHFREGKQSESKDDVHLGHRRRAISHRQRFCRIYRASAGEEETQDSRLPGQTSVRHYV